MRGSGRQSSIAPASSARTASGAASGAILGVLLGVSPAHADEPVSAREARLMTQTGENTTVIGAFDRVISANLLLVFHQEWKTANIRRETSLSQPGLSSGGFVAATENVAKFKQTVSTLDIGADIGVGLVRDLALSVRLPLILADSRELTDLSGSAANPQRLQDSAGETLFKVPFKSPTRSGIDQFGVELNYAIFNQVRDESKPTWVIGAESRFAVGSRLHACNEGAAIQCPDPVTPTGPSREPGISRGMTTLAAHTISSRRFGYLEPYLGFRGQVELPQSNSDFGATSDVKGTLLTRPPLVGTFTFGTEVFPYENREAFQRVALDFKMRAIYYSPGREYSELFDALGSSQARSLREPNPGAYRGDAFSSTADPTAPKVYFTGITDQQAYASFGGSMGITWQAGRFVKFNAGLGLTYAQSHLITAADACNPDKGDPATSGPCRAGAVSASGGTATGIPNPNHRPTIDVPGRRFSVDDTTFIDLWVSAIAMF